MERFSFSHTLTAAGNTLCTAAYGSFGRIRSVVVNPSATSRTVTLKDTFTPTASNNVGSPVSTTVTLMTISSGVNTQSPVNTVISDEQLGEQGIKFNNALSVVGSADDASVTVTVVVEFV